MNEVTNNMVNYVNDYKVEFSSPIFTKINEITEQQQNMVQVLREINLISKKFDGKIPESGIPIIYNTTSTDKVDNSSTSAENTFQELCDDYKKVLLAFNQFYEELLCNKNSTSSDEPFITEDGSNYDEDTGTFNWVGNAENDDLVNQHMFLILSNVFNNEDKLEIFNDAVITAPINKNGRLKRIFRRLCNEFADIVKEELGEEQKLIEDFKSLQSYTSFVNNSDGVIEGKVREFDYSTVVIAADISQQQTLLKELYRPAGGDKWDSVVKFI